MGAGKVVGLVGVVALVAIAFGAYKVLFNRKGEAAIQLIPANADVVVTLDTSPSESQVMTFKKISDALEREGIADKIDDQLKSALNNSELGKELRPLLSTSFAYYLSKSQGKEHHSVLTALKNPSAAMQALSRYGTKSGDDIYQVKEINSYCSVVGEYLVCASDGSLITQIRSVRDGSTESIAKSAEYQAARSALPSDANLMVFVSPQQLHEIQQSVTQTSPQGMSWMAFGATIREDGIAFDYRGPIDAKLSSFAKAFSEISPIDRQFLNELPSGALGVLAVSQPGHYWTAFKTEFEGNDEIYSEARQAISKFEKDSGLSIEKDLIPSLNGDVLFAAYPGATQKPEDIDIAILLNDKNGANPGSMLPKLRDFLAKQKQPIMFTEKKIGDGTIWELSPDSRAEFEKSAGDAPALKNKTPIVAALGKNAVLTTGRALFGRIQETTDANSLASDPPYAAMSVRLVDGSQSNIMVSLRRIMEYVRPLLEESMKDAPVSIDDVIEIFGEMDTGMVGSGKYDGAIGTGNFFLPMDYERLISLIGTLSSQKPSSSSSSKGEYPDYEPMPSR